MDGYNAEKLDQQELFAWTGETNDQYRLTIGNTGNHNPNGNGSTNVIIDYFTFNLDQTKLADVTALQQALDKFGALNGADYDAELWQATVDAAQAARGVYVDATASQKAVDDAAAALEQAMKDLVATPEPTASPEPTTTPAPTAQPTAEPTQVPQPTQGPVTTDAPQATQQPGEVPPTGDNAPMAVMTGVLLASAMAFGGLVVAKKRRQS